MNSDYALARLMAGCLIVFGGGVVYLGIYGRRQFARSKSWPKTEGVILQSSIEPEWCQIGGGFARIISPKVVYEYRVNGKKYTASRLALVEHDSADERLARSKAEKYSAGQSVDVYYDPQKPASATLAIGDPTEGTLTRILFVIGALLIIGGAVWLCWR